MERNMSKVVNTLCDSCDSEFSLSFNENLVIEHENIICPFCGETIEPLEEDIEDDFDLFQNEENWE